MSNFPPVQITKNDAVIYTKSLSWTKQLVIHVHIWDFLTHMSHSQLPSSPILQILRDNAGKTDIANFSKYNWFFFQMLDLWRAGKIHFWKLSDQFNRNILGFCPCWISGKSKHLRMQHHHNSGILDCFEECVKISNFKTKNQTLWCFKFRLTSKSERSLCNWPSFLIPFQIWI